MSDVLNKTFCGIELPPVLCAECHLGDTYLRRICNVALKTHNSRMDYDRRLAELDGSRWVPDLEGTLLFIVSGDEVLLIRKLTGHGAGKINGPGGKMEAGETPLQCVLRETREEVGLVVADATLAAEFRFFDLVDQDWLGHVFVAHDYEGAPTASPEADPFWCGIDALPFADMWPDDRYWLPRVLAGERLRGSFLFEQGELRAHTLRPIDPSS